MKTIPLFKVFMHSDAAPAASAVLNSGYIGQGPKVEAFEETLRKHFGCPWVNTLNSATSGLQLAVHMAKEEAIGRHILTTPLTCTATNWAILSERVNIRWVDVDPATGNMDMKDLAQKVNWNTLAIMVVHWGGYPCDLDFMKGVQALWNGPPIIEDCAHAWGATYKGKPVGTHGNTCVFSFQAIKHLTTGDGGCMLSPNEDHYLRAKLLRWYGLDRNSSTDFRCQQNIKEWGFKFHMNDIAASIGLANYPHNAWIVERHRSNGRYYNMKLAGVPGLTLMENKPDRESSFWVYTIRVQYRDGFVRKMKERGIATSQVHARNDLHDCVQQYRCHLPGMDLLEKEMICIPCGWWVTEEDREYIADCIRGGW